MLRKYLHDVSHVLSQDEILLNEDLTNVEVLIVILDNKVHELMNKRVMLIKVQWSRHGSKELTWKNENETMSNYSSLLSPGSRILRTKYF